MLKYEVTDEFRQFVRQHEPLVKGAIAVLANKQFGTEGTGIFKWEGGVVVNNRDIVIKLCHIVDDFRKQDEPTAEELAVVDAICAVQEMWRKGPEELASFAPCNSGDPLRCLGWS